MKRLLVLLPFLALMARADDGSLMTIHRIETETADRVQARVLDPILGAGQSTVYVRLALEMKREYQHSDRLGEGQTTKVKSRVEPAVATTTTTMNANEGDAQCFGFGNCAKSPYDEKQTQESRQTKGVKEEVFAVSYRYTGFHLVILHDAKISPSKIAAARTALQAIYKRESGVDINFHPVEFSALK